MDPSLNLEARRLFVAAALTMHVARIIKGRVLSAGSDARDLLSLARSLDAEHVEHAHGISFDPPYPGLTSGVEITSSGLRLLLACRAYDGRDGTPLGVVFTTLISGRSPQVSVAPASTPIPEGWLPPDKPS